MENCSDPCGGCKPKCKRCKHDIHSCECENDVNCISNFNKKSPCTCSSCMKKIKCDVSCEKKESKCDPCNCSSSKYECKVSCEHDENCQTHVHEVQGSTYVSGKVSHSHRIASMTGEAIRTCDSHIHKIKFKTNFAGHFHYFEGQSGPAIALPCGKHTHFIESCTSVNDCHKHEFALSTLIENSP